MTFVKECAWSDTARRVISLHFPLLFFAYFITKLCRIVQNHALKCHPYLREMPLQRIFRAFRAFRCQITLHIGQDFFRTNNYR